MGKQWKQWLTLFWGAPKLLQMVTSAMKLKDTYSLEVTWTLTPRLSMTNLDSILKSRDITNKGPSSQSDGFSSSHVLDYKGS